MACAQQFSTDDFHHTSQSMHSIRQSFGPLAFRSLQTVPRSLPPTVAPFGSLQLRLWTYTSPWFCDALVCVPRVLRFYVCSVVEKAGCGERAARISDEG